MAWPAVQLCMFAPFRRGVPRKAIVLACLSVLYALSIVGLVLYFPTALPGFAILAACALVYEGWRTRPGYGKSRGFPPGSLAIVSLEPCRDHLFYKKQAERHGPIFKTGSTLPYLTFRPIVCVVGHEHALRLLRYHDDALAVSPPAPFSRFIPRGFLRYMKPDDHKVYRRILQSAISPEVIQNNDAFIISSVRDTLTQMVQDCAGNGGNGVRPRDYLDTMLVVILAEIFFGIPQDSESFAKLQTLYRSIDISRLSRVSLRGENEKVIDEMVDILRQQVQQSGIHSGAESNKAPSFLSAAARARPEVVDDPTVVGNLIYMVEAARNDVTALLVWVLKMLSDYPQWTQQVRNGADEQSALLADRIVAETLRLEQSEYLFRLILRDIQFDGYTIPKGWVLRVCVREGHRDSSIFEDPDVFNPNRSLGRSYGRSEYAPFGLHGRSCLGVTLTQAIGRAFVNQIAGSFEWEVVDDGPREFGRFHWEPSAKFRVNITSRS